MVKGKAAGMVVALVVVALASFGVTWAIVGGSDHTSSKPTPTTVQTSPAASAPDDTQDTTSPDDSQSCVSGGFKVPCSQVSPGPTDPNENPDLQSCPDGSLVEVGRLCPDEQQHIYNDTPDTPVDSSTYGP